MYFPIADVTAHPLSLPLVAFCVSFFSSMGGISGAFLLLPYQMSFLGYTNPSVSATNQFYNIVAIPSGVYRFIKEKRMVWPLAIVIALGTLPGVFVGALVRVLYLPDPKNFKLFAALVISYIMLKLLIDIKRSKSTEPKKATPQPQYSQIYVTHTYITKKAIHYTFQDKAYTCPLIPLFCLSLVIGVIGGCYGIGGGAIMAPLLVSWFRLPIHTIGGSTLLGTFLTSITSVIFYYSLNPFFPELTLTPDWMLGGLLGVGGLLGMYCGARCQKFIPANAVKLLLCILMFFTAIMYIKDFFD